MSNEHLAGSTAEKYKEMDKRNSQTHSNLSDAKKQDKDEGTTDDYTQNAFDSVKNLSSQNLVETPKIDDIQKN